MNLPENIRILRKQKNLSQEALAEKLNISRQAVSKWESGNAYPEVDKLMMLCELFNCTMDDLIKKEFIETDVNLKSLYEKTMNRFSLQITFGVSLILLGVSLMLALIKPSGSDEENILAVIILLLFISMGTGILIFSGIKQDHFKKKYVSFPNFYTQDELDHFEHTFAIMMAIGVCIILLGVIILLLFNQELDADKLYPVVIFMLLITISVSIFIYFGTQKDKYSMNDFKEIDEELKRKNDNYSGIIMMSATILFFLLGFVFNLWQIAWVVFPIGGISCGILSNILEAKKK